MPRAHRKGSAAGQPAAVPVPGPPHHGADGGPSTGSGFGLSDSSWLAAPRRLRLRRMRSRLPLRGLFFALWDISGKGVAASCPPACPLGLRHAGVRQGYGIRRRRDLQRRTLSAANVSGRPVASDRTDRSAHRYVCQRRVLSARVSTGSSFTPTVWSWLGIERMRSTAPTGFRSRWRRKETYPPRPSESAPRGSRQRRAAPAHN